MSNRKALIVYSSRETTGNTLKLAEALRTAFGDCCDTAAADNAPSPDKYAFVMLGFGVYRGWPDGDMRAYMRRCRNLDIGIFMTLGAWPDSAHAHNCIGRAEGLTDSCRVRARFICHGRLDPEMVERMKKRPAGTPHSWDSERERRVNAAESHPDDADLSAAAAVFMEAWKKLGAAAGGAPGSEREAIVLAAFGTTCPAAMTAYDNIERVAGSFFPGVPLFRAYTSGMVRRGLAAAGTTVKSVAGVLNGLSLGGYTAVRVISLHIFPGEEYHRMKSDIMAFRNAAAGFRVIYIGSPLLYDAASLGRVCDVLTGLPPRERKRDDAVVFMGHGNRHGHGDFHYLALRDELRRRDENIFLATVEGGLDFDSVLETLRRRAIRRVYLMPFMVVSGEHARNDLAGSDRESWRSRLAAEGIEAIPVLKGLGEYDEFAVLFAGQSSG